MMCICYHCSADGELEVMTREVTRKVTQLHVELAARQQHYKVGLIFERSVTSNLVAGCPVTKVLLWSDDSSTSGDVGAREESKQT